MTSKQRKKLASRNGAMAAGTKSPEGIQKSAMNAVKHGLTGKAIVLSNESQPKFDELHLSYIQEFQPQTCAERDLIDDMVAARWRLKRIRILQTSAIDLQMDRMDAEIAKTFKTIDQATRTVVAVGKLVNDDKTLEVLHRYEVSYTRMYERALKTLRTLQAERAESGEYETPEPEKPIFRNEPDPVPETHKITPEPSPAPALLGGEDKFPDPQE